ncbi:MAG: hypothetical protein HRT37_25065 [Alteromonadaceae bacterium]|nr:hypothetical protein [Alteromonadaceae bacterium]
MHNVKVFPKVSNNIVHIADVSGIYHAVERAELIKVAQNSITDKFIQGEALTSSIKTANYLQVLLGDYEHEVFYAIWLNSQHKVLKAQELFRGTINAASVYPREVVKEGLAVNAAAVIFAHNHPSGTQELSRADIEITKRLKEALKLFEINTLDHFVIGAKVTSMAEKGLL